MSVDGTVKSTIYIIAGAFIVCSFFFLFTCFCSRQHTVSEVRITIDYPIDSISSTSIPIALDKSATDSIVSQINRQQDELNRNYQLFMKARQDDADILKYVSICIGFIISALAILWFRGIKEFLDTVEHSVLKKSEEAAKEETQRIVRGEVARAMNEEIKKQAFLIDIKESVVKNVQESYISFIQEDVNDLKNRVDKLSSESTPDDQPSITEEPEQRDPMEGLGDALT